jgi:Dimerisation domain
LFDYWSLRFLWISQVGAWDFPNLCNLRLLDSDITQELTPEEIMQLGLGFWGSKTLLSAIELGLFTELAKGPLHANDIENRLKLHPRSVRDFLDALVALHMLDRDEDGRFQDSTNLRLLVCVFLHCALDVER